MQKKTMEIFTCGVLAVSLAACGPSQDTALEKAEYEKYISPFCYSLGGESWDDPREIEPDALVVFFFSLPLAGEITIDKEDYPKDDEFGNPMIPSEVLEPTVQKYLDVPADQIRKSTYYDSERDAYWTGGIGSVVQLFLENAEKDGNLLRIDFTARIDAGEGCRQWRNRVTIRLEEDGGYRYLSFEKGEEEQME